MKYLCNRNAYLENTSSNEEEYKVLKKDEKCSEKSKATIFLVRPHFAMARKGHVDWIIFMASKFEPKDT